MVTRVYEIDFEVDNFQSLLSDDDDSSGELFEYDGRSKAASWKPPRLWVDSPQLPAPDLWYPLGRVMS